MDMFDKDNQPQAVIENVSRRDMLKGVVAGGGLVLAAQFLPKEAMAAAWKPYPTGADGMPGKWVWDPHVFVSIDSSGTVTIVAHRSEMGTGSRTSMPMIVADEMEADWSRVKIVQAPGDEKKYGNQDTDGSRSLRHFIQPMRACGAAARQMLEAAAAKKWGVDVAQVEAKNHEVHLKGGSKKLGFGELAADAAALPTPAAESLNLKDPKQWKYIGKGKTQITDLRDITVGKATYAQDIVKPGMLFAVVDRPPVLLGKAVKYDEAAAMAVPGVVKVVAIDPTPPPFKFAPKGGVAVIAKNTWAAMKGREALKTEWDDGPNKVYNSDTFKKTMQEQARQPGKVERKEGDVEAALKGADKVIEHDYYIPHFAHATMEPPAATCIVNGDKAEVWACVQSPGGTRGDVAKTLGLKEDDVTVNVTLLGGGFGRKSKCDFALEAAILAKTMPGTPVKVVWTREDDLKHGFYHSVSAQNVTAGVKDGKVVAFRHRSVSPSLMSNFMPDPKRESALELGLGLIDTPYAVANLQLETGEAPSHTRIGWFRSVNNIPHAFAAQSFINELAHELKRDPKDFLLEMIGPDRIVDVSKTATSEPWNYGDPYATFPIDTKRLKHVIEVAAKEAGWGTRKLGKGWGMGIAGHRSFLTYVATVVIVHVDEKGNLDVPEVHTAIDAGFVANPERVRSQVEGGSVMALSLAKYGQITYKDGRVEQNNFNDYKVLRIGQGAMNVHTHIIPHPIDVVPSGVGEPPVPPFSPALVNAIFAATGKRIRELPIGDTISV